MNESKKDESDLNALLAVEADMKDDLKELYEMKANIDAVVKENFGYCPNTESFNALEKKWRDKEFEVSVLYPSEYDKYCNTVYS